MWRFLGLCLMFLAILRPAVCRHPKRTTEEADDQNVLLQHAVKSLLGFDDLSRREVGVGPNPFTSKVAPKFMLDLYQKYKDGRIRTGSLTANTVRSIQSDIGIVNRENLFVLNLTSIGPYESLVKGEIHLYKKRMKAKHRSWNIIITAHELAPGNIRELDQLRIPGRTRGWQALDLTSALRSCLGTPQRTNHMLALSFQLENKAGNHSLLDLREFVQILSRPFLVVFSNDTQRNITLDHIDPHFHTEELAGSYVNPENGRREDFSDLDWAGFNQRKKGGRQRKRKHDTGHSGSRAEDDPLSAGNRLYRSSEPKDMDNALDTLPEDSDEEKQEEHPVHNAHARTKRSIHDNRIPEDPYLHVVTSARYNMPETHPTILHDRLQSRHQSSNIEGEELSDNRKRRRRKHRKNKKKDRKKMRKEENFPVPGLWKGLSEKEPNDSPPGGSRGQEMCGKRALVVDFADIGWSDWIISPKSFRAQYCAGSCPFPIAQRLNPSNHATIQSLVHAIGIQNAVPAPCCVPDKLSSVTLLFFDLNNNVVLKNYPGMTVESCACR